VGRPAIGRSTPLELSEILDRALRIVDTEGRDELTMRRLAKELGVTPMAVYHHLPDKPALLAALVDLVWLEIFSGLPPLSPDPVEGLVQLNLRVREVWLRHSDLANLAVAVAEPDDSFYELTKWITETVERSGFPDVALAYSAVQNFTMGSIQTSANRRMASLYFGRDPESVRAEAQRLLQTRGASAHHVDLVEARFDSGDDAHFEPTLRSLIDGLLAGTSR
jgi:AcrR family transcriptional regulator